MATFRIKYRAVLAACGPHGGRSAIRPLIRPVDRLSPLPSCSALTGDHRVPPRGFGPAEKVEHLLGMSLNRIRDYLAWPPDRDRPAPARGAGARRYDGFGEGRDRGASRPGRGTRTRARRHRRTASRTDRTRSRTGKTGAHAKDREKLRAASETARVFRKPTELLPREEADLAATG
jgi:hypothetical protein